MNIIVVRLTNSCPVLKFSNIAFLGDWKLLCIYTCNWFLILMECIYYVNFTHNNKPFIYLLFMSLKKQMSSHRSHTKAELVFECEDMQVQGYQWKPILVYFVLFWEDTKLRDNDSCFSIDREGTIMKSSGVYLVNTNVSGLGLYSIANNISSLGGEYCFHQHSSEGSTTDGRSKTGTIVFCFQFCLCYSTASNGQKGALMWSLKVEAP